MRAMAISLKHACLIWDFFKKPTEYQALMNSLGSIAVPFERLLQLAITTAVVCLSMPQAQADHNFFGQTPKIMPLGDSITEGFEEYLISYRRDLWHTLDQNGYSVDFVGSKADTPASTVNPALLDFDVDYEAYSGWRADQVNNQLTTTLQTITPDIVLLHLGTNDIFQGESVASTIADLTTTITILRANNPDVLIFLAQIIPMDSPDVTPLNTEIAVLAGNITTSQSPVLLVDHQTGYDPAILNFDNWHPTAAGEAEMASRWFAALEPFFQEPVAGPDPVAVPLAFWVAPVFLGIAALAASKTRAL